MPIHFTPTAQPDLTGGERAEVRADLRLSSLKSDLKTVSRSQFVAVAAFQVAIACGVSAHVHHDVDAVLFGAAALLAMGFASWLHFSTRRIILKSFNSISSRAKEAERQNSILMAQNVRLVREKRRGGAGEADGDSHRGFGSPSATIHTFRPWRVN